MQQLDLFGEPLVRTAKPVSKPAPKAKPLRPPAQVEALPPFAPAEAPALAPTPVVPEPVAPAVLAPAPALATPPAQAPTEDPTPPAYTANTAPAEDPVLATSPVGRNVVLDPPSAAPRSSNKKTSTTSLPGKRGRKSFKEMDAELGLIDVPSKEALKEKLYYPISEVATWFRVNTSLLRYWENEFDVLKPRKTRKGDRLFRVEDIQYLKQIYFLLREKKFSIEGAKAYLKNNKPGTVPAQSARDTLLRLKEFLLTLRASLD